MEKPCCTDAARLSLADRDEQAGRRQESEGGCRPAAAARVGLPARRASRSTTASWARSISCASSGTAPAAAPATSADARRTIRKEMEFQIRNWGCFVWLYGDNIVEQHVHNIDIANWVMCRDGNAPERPSGRGQRHGRPREPRQLRRHLRPPLRRVHLRRRHEGLQPVAAHRRHLGPGDRVRPRRQGQSRPVSQRRRAASWKAAIPTTRSTSTWSRRSSRARSSTTAGTAPSAA